jgi:hypothetical protein
MDLETWLEKNEADLYEMGTVEEIATAAWQASQAEQANVIANQMEMLNRLRNERDALLRDVGLLVDDDFGSQCWTMSLENAAKRLRKLVAKMRDDYDE